MDATLPPPRRASSPARTVLPWLGVALLPGAVLLAPATASSRAGFGLGTGGSPSATCCRCWSWPCPPACCAAARCSPWG
ncbi:hypothetical protein AB0873_08155 [Micromonospora sp. NPDC047707]|uniref:hypothetical protein n=1 Tax=Micromonospora sp. NPDC047707 TaxID=3154498 RepID=UPI003452E8F3